MATVSRFRWHRKFRYYTSDCDTQSPPAVAGGLRGLRPYFLGIGERLRYISSKVIFTLHTAPFRSSSILSLLSSYHVKNVNATTLLRIRLTIMFLRIVILFCSVVFFHQPINLSCNVWYVIHLTILLHTVAIHIRLILCMHHVLNTIDNFLQHMCLKPSLFCFPRLSALVYQDDINIWRQASKTSKIFCVLHLLQNLFDTACCVACILASIFRMVCSFDKNAVI